MRFDAYAPCPCGSGKKVKFCSPRSLDQVAEMLDLLNTRQVPAARRILEKIVAEPDKPECLSMFCSVLDAQIHLAEGELDKAASKLEETIERYPAYGMPHDLIGGLALDTGNYHEALDELKAALACYPPEATVQRLHALFGVGRCHLLLGRPMAAWAAWQQALKIDPSFQPAQSAITEAIIGNELLPAFLRQGARLKSPDELAVFNDERRKRWDQALTKEIDWHVDDLVMAFDFLTQDDPSDLAAWHNLALARAWVGDNVGAIEALEQYVRRESDFDAAASAWDLAEVLRFGADAGDLCDARQFIAVYEIVNLQAVVESLQSSKQLITLSTGPQERPIAFWVDKAPPAPNEPHLLGGPPRRLAQVLLAQTQINLVASSAEALAECRRQLAPILGDAARFVEEVDTPRNPQSLDIEPMLVLVYNEMPEEERRNLWRAEAEDHFESKWIHRPLKALSGLSPIDAAQSPEFKKRLEGVVRYRERNFARYDTGYDFDRLRNKLGLELSGPPVTKPHSLSASNAEQLAKLNPSELSDEELETAYRTANNLDVPVTALRIGRELTRRPALQAKLETVSVFRRLIVDRIENHKLDEARTLLVEAEKVDSVQHDGDHADMFASLRAKLHLAEGKSDDALEVLRKRIDAEPDNLDLLAQGVESLLRADQYKAALELAELGLKRSDEYRKRDFRDQFKEYQAAAKARLR